MPKISVVIPTYNYSRYIGRALKSVFRQSYCDFEVIVVDDGSTDDTREIVEKYTGSPGHQVTRSPVNIKYIYQENKGRGAARQHGVDESQGEYVAFLDSDDEWLPEKLEKQMDYIKKNAFSGMLHARVCIIDENGFKLKKENDNLNKEYSYGIRNGFDYVSFLNRSTLFLSTAILPRELILRTGGFKSNFKILEDLDFILRTAKISKIDFLDEQLAYHNVHSGNTFRAAREDIARAYVLICSRELRTLNNVKNPKKRKKGLIYIYEKLINFSHELRNKQTAFLYLKKLIKEQPLYIFKIRGCRIMLKLFISSFKI